jgi:hypothetical protein
MNPPAAIGVAEAMAKEGLQRSFSLTEIIILEALLFS